MRRKSMQFKPVPTNSLSNLAKTGRGRINIFRGHRHISKEMDLIKDRLVACDLLSMPPCTATIAKSNR
ncbi:hypothetical protein CEXT_674491 [Caerostris extrusa]|uniref:Uncharacterized protein n=1 Tax=Caerostris extrusa TaxID=172846 RepID=A0AAV4SB27_CAEEX|nr:hypothetical protein CEXT_674491 [Caerostris extrusa]